MGNCLKTQLKEAVQNEMLPILGYQQIKMSVSSPLTIYGDNDNLCIPKGSNNEPIIIGGDGYFVDNNGNNIGKSLNNNLETNSNGIHIDSEIYLNIPPYTRIVNRFMIQPDNVNWDIDIKTLVYAISHQADRFIAAPKIASGNIVSLFNKGKFFMRFLPKTSSPDVVGNIDDIVFEALDTSRVDSFGFGNMPNITGNVESILNKLAAATTTNYRFQMLISNCPNLKYENTFIVGSFNKYFNIKTDHTWEETT